MGNKSITCPICGHIGTLGVEKRIIKNRKKTRWEHMLELRKKFPKMSDYDLMGKIPKEPGKWNRNILTKKYERKRSN